MSKHHSPQEENIYSSACIQALEQEYCSSCSAAVVSSCIVSRGFGERLVSRIYNGGRRAVYTAAVGAMLANNTALPAYGAGTYVSAGKTVTGATITSGNSQIIYSAGVADSTTIYGGLQVVSPGGVATNTTMSQDGWQFVSSGGVASNTTINPGGSGCPPAVWQILPLSTPAVLNICNPAVWQMLPPSIPVVGSRWKEAAWPMVPPSTPLVG